MAVTQKTFTFGYVNTGGYDNDGVYYSDANDSVNDVTQAVFYAFDAGSIQQLVNSITVQSVTLTYTLSSSDFFETQYIDVGTGTLSSTEQARVDADKTDGTGSTLTANATVYKDITQFKQQQVQVYDTSVTKTLDVAVAVENAAQTGQQLFADFYDDTGHSNTGITTVSNVSVTVTGLVSGNDPAISGTTQNQPVLDDKTLKPFAGVTLQDVDNSSGAGDEVQLTILDGDGNSTGAYGTFSGPGITFDDGQGDITVGPASSLGALQAELDGLTFTPAKLAAGAPPVVATFALDIQSGAGGTGLNQASAVITHDTACYCSGTLILTDRGQAAVETIAVGDTVVTAAGEYRRVRWMGNRSFAGRFLAANPGVQPVRFRAGSLGGGLPRRDLLVSPDHAMMLDGMLIPARCLVNGTTVTKERVERVDYFHVELDSHDVLLAEGAPSESFVDDDSRGGFHNAADYAVLYPGRSRPAEYCAPRVEGGHALERVRRRLAAVAAVSAAA